jgi:hypothetical protein
LLPAQDFLPGVRYREPLALIHLGKVLDYPGPWWPNERKSVAVNHGGIEVMFSGPSFNELAAALNYFAQFEDVAVK